MATKKTSTSPKRKQLIKQATAVIKGTVPKGKGAVGGGAIVIKFKKQTVRAGGTSGSNQSSNTAGGASRDVSINIRQPGGGPTVQPGGAGGPGPAPRTVEPSVDTSKFPKGEFKPLPKREKQESMKVEVTNIEVPHDIAHDMWSKAINNAINQRNKQRQSLIGFAFGVFYGVALTLATQVLLSALAAYVTAR